MSYLIEFRFQGKAKYEIKRMIWSLNKKFHIRPNKRPVPHITLVGPLATNNEKRLIGDFNNICSSFPLMKFTVDGFDTFNHSNVVYININPDKKLDEFRWELSQRLKSYCKLRPFDYERNFSFHATLAMRLPYNKFKIVKSYVHRMKRPKYRYVLVRATLLKGGIILREYDFLLRRPLTRRLAKSREIYSKTMDLLNAFFEGKYDPNQNIKEEVRNVQDKSLFSWVKEIFTKPKTFITSDLHLDHTNIIKYCKRPFLNTEEMNKSLIQNWNNTITYKDTVYFLGDLAFGKGSKTTDYWLKQLNGKIIFIKGNHDKSKNIDFHQNYKFEYKDHTFYLTHDPSNVPRSWKGWAICGHHHNNKPQEYPFIDKKNKKINISVELTKYMPIDMDELIRLIEN